MFTTLKVESLCCGPLSSRLIPKGLLFPRINIFVKDPLSSPCFCFFALVLLRWASSSLSFLLNEAFDSFLSLTRLPEHWFRTELNLCDCLFFAESKIALAEEIFQFEASGLRTEVRKLSWSLNRLWSSLNRDRLPV